MNRRTFLLSVGLTACSGPSKKGSTTTTGTTSSGKHDPPPRGGGIVDGLWRASQRAPSPLAFHDDVLFQSLDGEIRSWDASTKKRLDAWTLPHRHFCIARDGAVIAFGFAKGSSSVVHRIANGRVDSMQGPPMLPRGMNVVLAGRASDEIYVTAQDDIHMLRISGGSVQLASTFAHPSPNSPNRDQWFSRGDGRIVGIDRSEGFTMVSGSRTAEYFPTEDRVVTHLAAATRERIWYSFASIQQDYNAKTLVLAPLDKPMANEQTLDLSPGRAVHVASFGATLAALLFTEGQTRADAKWTVVVFEESGQERWRAEVPRDFPSKAMLNNGFIAIGEHHVAIAAADGSLLFWNASDGSPG